MATPGVGPGVGMGSLVRGRTRYPTVLPRRLNIYALPRELWILVLRFLDVPDLLRLLLVNRHFRGLASDNEVWRLLYMQQSRFVTGTAGPPGRRSERHPAQLQGQLPEGHWKHVYLGSLQERFAAAMNRLQPTAPVNPCTGMSPRMRGTLCSLHIRWSLQLVYSESRTHEIETDAAVARGGFGDCGCGDGVLWLREFGASVRFDTHSWPQKPLRLRISALVPVRQDLPLYHRSLLGDWPLPPASQPGAGSGAGALPLADSAVSLHSVPPGLLVGVWKRVGGLAFVQWNTPLQTLVKQITMGSSTRRFVESVPPPLPSDINPRQGLYGYSAAVSMSSHSRCCFYNCYTGIDSRPEDVWDGMLSLTLFDKDQKSHHDTLPAPLAIHWETSALVGNATGGCILDVSLRESGMNLWSFSEPVCVLPSPSSASPPPSPGRSPSPPWSLRLAYADDVGTVEVELCPENFALDCLGGEDYEREGGSYIMMSLVLRVRLAMVNRWFGTNY